MPFSLKRPCCWKSAQSGLCTWSLKRGKTAEVIQTFTKAVSPLHSSRFVFAKVLSDKSLRLDIQWINVLPPAQKLWSPRETTRPHYVNCTLPELPQQPCHSTLSVQRLENGPQQDQFQRKYQNNGEEEATEEAHWDAKALRPLPVYSRSLFYWW